MILFGNADRPMEKACMMQAFSYRIKQIYYRGDDLKRKRLLKTYRL
jgi:hypothetical protein